MNAANFARFPLLSELTIVRCNVESILKALFEAGMEGLPELRLVFFADRSPHFEATLMHRLLVCFSAVRVLFTLPTDDAAVFARDYGSWSRVEVIIDDPPRYDSDRESADSAPDAEGEGASNPDS